MVTQPRWLRALSLATVTIVSAAITAWIPVAAQADTAPEAGTASTVSSDSLPTVQVNGVVWTQIIVGNTVYVGGEFTQAQPAGAAAGVSTVSRTNMLAYNLTTGALITSFAPTFNAQVRGLAASPDGSTVYAVGNFTQVNGVNRYRIVALDAGSGAVRTNFAPTLNTAAYSVVATSSTVYVGGAFTVVGSSTTRTRAAAFSASNGALTAWAPNVPDHLVRAMVLSPDGSKLVLGGSFNSLNGSTSPGQGLGAVDSTTGASVPWNVGQRVYNHGDNASIYSLWSDGTNVYGTGYVYGGLADGNLEGAFNASWTDGTINWVEDCHGDSYSVAALGDAVYTVSHDHYCGNVPGGFQQTDPSPSTAKKQYALAFSKAVAGTLAHDTYGPPYADWGGTPAPKLLTWYPDLMAGTYTGQSQAAWNVTAGNGYLLLGGEFPSVNGKRQTGLARFATSATAPNTDGPRLGGANWVPSAVSLNAGSVRVSWPANWDRDNANLTYTVTRNGGSTPVYTNTAESEGFWLRPTMGFVDTGLTPGSTVSYRVKATDPFGNTAVSTTVTTTVSAGSGSSAYANAVIGDGATDFWRLGEANGPTVYDWAGYSDLTAGAGVGFGATGAIVGDGNTAASFSGDSTGLAATATSIPGPQTFSIETWFKTTSTAGGKIVGFGNSNTGTSSSYDRHVYMDSAGHVLFGVYPGFSATVQSGGAYNDGKWHYVVASLSGAGQQLYVDGKRVGNNPGVTSAQSYNGYWRVGGDTSWSGANFFAGSIDDTAIYPTALSSATVKSHWAASGNGSAAAAPTDAYGKQIYANGPDSYWRLGDSAGSTTVADASGNGTSATANSGVAFGAAGGVRGTSDTSASFDGDSGLVVSSQAQSDPEVYSLELWFNTTTNRGGKLIGFGDRTSGTSGNYDRHVWMLDSGQLEFGVWTGQTNTITSPSTYNDGTWHHLVATQGSDGLKLYVDSVLVGTNPQTHAQGYTGYWRLGGDTTWGGNSSTYFAGKLDEVAIYGDVLSAGQVANDYQLGAAAANVPPTAGFTATATNLDVAFDASSSTDSDGSVVGWSWDYGDGTTGSGAAATHSYGAPGTYTVALTVTDDKGATNTVSKTVTVSAANVSPKASFTAGANGLGVAFDGSASSDPDGSIASYAWDFGDGAVGTGATPSHTYTASGTYTVALTVKDDKGATDTATKSVTVTAPNTNPVASFSSSSDGLAASFDGSASSDADGTVASYSWSFGDGASGTGAKPSHTYPAAGTYTVKLTVTDDQGGTGSATRSITVAVANTAPTASFTSTPSGLKTDLDGSASADPDGTIASYAWDFGDGTTGTGATTSHTYAAAGAYTVKLTVTDDKGATGVLSQTVNVSSPANSAPTASFTSSASGLTVGLDGTGSTDADGTVKSYAWDFGDGSDGTGATTSHTYAAGGVYTVTLTVTDDGSATASTSKSLTVTNPAASMLARDSFNRTVSSGLGSADTGGSWTLSGTAADYSVSPQAARISTPVDTTRSAYLPGVSSSSSDVSATVSIPALQTGGTAYWGVVGRRIGSDDYNARLRVFGTGAVSLQILRGGTVLQTASISGWTYTAGTPVKVRLQVFGTSPTTVQAKAWRTSDAEPTSWQVSTTDTTSALQAPGSVGIRAYLGSGVTSGRTTFTFADFSAQSAGSPAAQNVAPTAAFTASANDLAASFDGSGSSDPDGSVKSWAWDFGDGSTGTGSSASHTYAAAGSYTVQLSVTDDKGAKGTTSKSVTVSAPASTRLAADRFERTVSSGLGSADTGGGWTTSGGASNFSVGSGAGSLNTQANATLSAYLNSVSSASSDVSATVTVPKLPVAGTLYAGVVGRRIGSDDYSTYLIVSASGAVSVAVMHGVNGVKQTSLPGVTATAGTVLHIRMTTTTASATTTLRARAWLDGSSQPSTWQVTGTDSTAALQGAGSVGLRTRVSSGTSNAPIAVKVDDFVADPAA